MIQKPKHKFIKLDIVEFYPSVSGNLLNKSIEFAVGLYRDDGLAAINGIIGNILEKKGRISLLCLRMRDYQ